MADTGPSLVAAAAAAAAEASSRDAKGKAAAQPSRRVTRSSKVGWQLGWSWANQKMQAAPLLASAVLALLPEATGIASWPHQTLFHIFGYYFAFLTCSGGRRRGRTPRRWCWRRQPASGSECSWHSLLCLSFFGELVCFRCREPMLSWCASCAANTDGPAAFQQEHRIPAARPHPAVPRPTFAHACRCRRCSSANEDMDSQKRAFFCLNR